MVGISSPTLVKQTGTTLTNLGPDGFTWAQAPAVVVDPFGKLVTIVNDNSSQVHFMWSNDGGATWSTPTTPIDGGFLLRASWCFDSGGAWVHVLWSCYAATDGILYRRYAVTRDGSNNITAISRARDTNVNLQLDFETAANMQYEHPVVLWIPEGGANGSLLALWTAYRTSGKSEVRASMRVLSLSIADNTAANWLAPVTAATDSLGNAPAVPYSAVSQLATAATTPGVAAIRKSGGANAKDVYVFYIEGANTGTTAIKFRRMRWNAGANNWSTGFSSVVTVTNQTRAGTDNLGYSLKYQLLTQPREDPVYDRMYIGFCTYKDNTSRDTWGFAYINASDGVSSLVDVYSAGSHSDNVNKFIDGDISIDKTTGRVAVAYLDLTAKSIWLTCYDNVGSRILTPVLVSAGAPFDTPTLTDGRIVQGGSDVVVITTRDFNAGAAVPDGSSPTYTPPYNAWIGKAVWDSFTVIPRTVQATQPQTLTLTKQPRLVRVLSQPQTASVSLGKNISRVLSVIQTSSASLTARRVALLNVSTVQTIVVQPLVRQVQSTLRLTQATAASVASQTRLTRQFSQAMVASSVATPTGGVQYRLNGTVQVHPQINLSTSRPSAVLLDVVWNTALKQFGTSSDVGLSLPLTQNLTFSPDATYDIGTTAANRPRNGYFTGSLVVGSSTSLTLGAASSGAYIVPSAGGALQFATGGISQWQIAYSTGHLLASTDNVRDIGASGANRPRDLYLGRNLAVGGTLAVTGTEQVQGGASFGTAPVAGQVTFGQNVRQTSGDTTFLRLGVGGGTDPSYDLRVNGAAWFGGNVAAGGYTTTGNFVTGGYMQAQYFTTSGYLQVGQEVRIGSQNEHIRNPVNAVNNLSIESADGYVMVGSKLNSSLMANAYWDGTSYQRFDVSKTAMVIEALPTSVAFYGAPSGANPIVFTPLMTMTSTGVLTLPNGSITTPMLAAGAAQQLIGSYNQVSVTFTTTNVGSWIVTPISVNVTTSGGTVRLETGFTMYHSVAGAFYYIALFRGGTLLCSEIAHQSGAGYNLPLTLVFYDAVGAGTYTYAVYVNNQAAGTITLQPSTSSMLWVNEQKR